jgi:hypothetical protein
VKKKQRGGSTARGGEKRGRRKKEQGGESTARGGEKRKRRKRMRARKLEDELLEKEESHNKSIMHRGNDCYARREELLQIQ